MTQIFRFIRPNSPVIALILAVPGVFLLGGCVVQDGPPPPVTVITQPDEAVVVEAPPPPREEVVVVRPSPEHVYIHGYWSWREGRHYWVAGHWELPPRRGVVWVEPRWEHRERGYVFVGGSWRDGPVAVHEQVTVSPSVRVGVNFIAQPPPPPRREVVVERGRPSGDHVWIKGYWMWREGRHVWIDGHWERPPHRGAVWVEPRWEHHPEGYIFIAGTWR
jgi:hypothetical protein